MKVLSSLFLLCFLSINILAQFSGSISGTIIDEGKKVKKLELTLKSENGETYTTETDSKGRYSFARLKDGKYKLSTGILGQSQEKKVVIVNGNSVTLNLSFNSSLTVSDQLPWDPIIREQVTVSAGTSQPISEVSKTVNVISKKETTERNEIGLTDTLRTVPGFRVQQLGGFGRTTSIKTRGLRNQDTAILIDGIRFRDPAAITGDASPFLSDFNTANIGRVEVLRGSGSSIYGTNALGGVIDFQTPDPQSEFNGSFLGEYGGFGMTRFRGDVGAGTKDGKLAFTTGFSKTKFTEGIDGDDDADNTNFQGRVDYNPFAKTNISGRVYLSDAFVRLNSNPDTLGNVTAGQIIDANIGQNFTTDINDPDNFQRSDFFSGQIALTQIINSQAIFSATYQGLKTNRKNENGGLGPGFQPFGGTQFSIFDGQIHTLNTKLDWMPVSNNRLTVGYEYEFEKYRNEGIGPTATGDFFARVNQSSNTIFAQNLLGLYNDKLQIAGGFRVQWFSLENPTFSVNNAPYENLTLDSPPTSYTFDGAASYYFSSTGTKIRGHIGNGYRAPSLYERLGSFYSSFSQSFTAIGDPNLEPERSIAFDVGIDQEIFENKVRLSATYFYTKLIDTIGYGNVVPNIGNTTRPFGGYLNQEGGIARGAEFSGHIRPSNSTDIFASYTFTNSDQLAPQVAGSGIIRTLGIPDHQFTLIATQRFGKKLSVNFDFLASSSYLTPIFSNTSFSTIIYRFEGNRRGDLTARYSFFTFKEKYNLNVFGTIENIFDNEYFENGFRTQGVSGRIGLGLSF